MNRRHFAQLSMAGLILGHPFKHVWALSASTQPPSMTTLKSKDGMILKLYDKQHPTADQDQSQYILTFDVFKNKQPLDEKIYELYDQHGRLHHMFMSPINHGQLQAVFNLRTHA